MSLRVVSGRLPLALLLVAGWATAQEPAVPGNGAQRATVSDASPAAEFRAAYARWTELDKQLNGIGQRYSSAADQAQRDQLKAEYSELVKHSETLLPELQKAAWAAFQAAPNADASATKVLIGLVAYEYRRDDYDAAISLAKQLFDAGCQEPVLYGIAGTAAYASDNYDLAEDYLTKASKAGKLSEEGQQFLADLPERKQLWQTEQAVRAKEAEADDLPRIKLQTSKGAVVIELFENEAPNAVANFVSLVEKKFYDGVPFHRVLPGFMAQGGDPTGRGTGGPGYKIACECYRDDYRHHFRGSLSMAHSGKDTGGSQFFLTFRPTAHLDGRHTCFGRVVEGLDVLPKLQRRDPNAPEAPAPDTIVKAEVLRKRDHAYQPKKVGQ